MANEARQIAIEQARVALTADIRAVIDNLDLAIIQAKHSESLDIARHEATKNLQAASFRYEVFIDSINIAFPESKSE